VRAEVRRNAFLLAGSLVCNSGAFQLAAALSSLTLVAVTGVKGILGLGPAIFLVAGGIAVGPAGQLMDRTGRMPVIRGGFVLGAAGLVGPWLLGIPFCSAWASVGTSRTSLPRPSSSRSRRPAERGRLVGFSDLCASFVAAALALLGGVVYSGAGVTALALTAAALAAIPGLWLAARPKPVPLAVAE
jgi:MFS family permease